MQAHRLSPLTSLIALLAIATPLRAGEAPTVSPVLQSMNERLAQMGSKIRIMKAEFLGSTTASSNGNPVGITIIANDREFWTLSQWAPNDARRNADGSNIRYLVDLSDVEANGGLASAQTEAAIDRAMATWNGVECARIPIVKQADSGTDPDVIDGLLGYGACYEALREADLTVLLGCDFPYDDFLPKRNVVQVDHDPRRLGRRVPLKLGVHGDVAATLRALRPSVRRKDDDTFLRDVLRRHERALTKVVDAYTRNIEHHTPIHPEYVASILDSLAPDDTVFTVDTGMNNVWAARYLTPNGRRRVIGSFTHGTMANALPHAIGAAYAAPDRKVVSMSGDGGLSMLLGELITVRQHGLPITTVVFNNSSLGMVRLEMMVDGMPAFETDHAPVDYAKVAEAVGMRAIRVEDPQDVREALYQALIADEPVLVDVVTDPNALSMPSKVTAGQVTGFALSAGRTVLRGGVGSMIDLARSNLRNIPRP